MIRPRKPNGSIKISQDRLKQLLTYNPCTGVFQWKVARQGIRTFKPGGAGHLDKFNGYRRITVDGISYLASRLAWVYIYGDQPEIIDHVDRVRFNDSIWNLSSGTTSDNMRNSRNYKDGKRVGENKNKYVYSYKPHKPWKPTQTEERAPDVSNI